MAFALKARRRRRACERWRQPASQAGTGGQAKIFIQAGDVFVNGEQEIRRRRKLSEGDVVQFDGVDYPVNSSSADN